LVSDNASYDSVQNLLSSRLLPKNVKIIIYKTITFSLFLSGCETLSLRGESRLRVFENRLLKIIFGTKRDEVIGDWRKLHNEEFQNKQSSSNIIIMIK
jgi:hypothetical protein